MCNRLQMGTTRTSTAREVDSKLQERRMKILYQIRDEMTPKIDGGGIAFTLRSRDYKGVIAIVISESDGAVDGE